VQANPGNRSQILKFEIDEVNLAKTVYDQGDALFMDARSKEDFDDGHIRGAISLPLGEFDDRINAFMERYPSDQPIITYCAGRTCEDSHRLAEKLMEFGYERVSIMIDGFPGWNERGYPVE